MLKEQVLNKEEPLGEGRQAKDDAGETAQRKQQMIKVDVKEKEPSVSRPETQTAEEVRKEGEGEKTKEIQEDKSEEAAKRGTKEV